MEKIKNYIPTDQHNKYENDILLPLQQEITNRLWFLDEDSKQWFQIKSNLEKIFLNSQDIISDIDKQIKQLQSNNLLDKFLPWVSNCLNFDQNNPYHKYNLREHTLHTVQHIQQNNPDLDNQKKILLSWVMLFHDIGKPDTVFFNTKKWHNTFNYHANKSIEKADKILTKLCLYDTQIDFIKKLIKYHDILIRYQFEEITKPKIDNLIHKLWSIENLKYLLIITNADINSQSDYKKQEKLNILENIRQYI